MARMGLSLVIATAMLALGCAGDDGGDDGGGTETDPTATDTNMTTMTTVGTTMQPTTMGTATTQGTMTGMMTADTGDTTGNGTTGGDDDSTGGTTTGVGRCVGMSFFATSEGSGENGGNLGGLDGADAFCQRLAEAAGQGACTWRAYLSTSTVDARDRIGTGPWENQAGDVIADSVQALHDDGLSNGMPQHILDENGMEVPGPQHDILTGSNEDGTYAMDASCADWTSNSPDDQGQVGHSDIPQQFSPSWNSAHPSQGCSEQNLINTAGSGRLYCFAL